jgi:5-methylcytosine-specific restriction protein A
MLNCTVHQRPSMRRAPDLRLSAARRGYGAGWRKKRAAFLAANPACEDCGHPATDVDHIPSRRELLAQGVHDPDADQYLHSRCHSDHTRKTNRQEGGGWRGRGIKSL